MKKRNEIEIAYKNEFTFFLSLSPSLIFSYKYSILFIFINIISNQMCPNMWKENLF